MSEQKMGEQCNSFSFKIMGEEYIIRGNDDPQYMREVASYIESIFKSIGENNPRLNKSQISVLAALRIADEYHKLRQQYKYLEEVLEQAR
ncbi:MAG TPA: cell division protein ZapA [Bacillota bacterium]|mgnify:CR=1 FL=1|nr:cell division protein ZapA [Bacillota bacterium]HOL08518.1 cell division protein ZapA [Bacillota bacterium]HPO97001.1 cell division protein ZapA [Bacillota bacterium]